MRRFFFHGSVEAGSRVAVRGTEAHHLGRVLRLRPGQEIVMVSGDGKQFTAVIEAFEKDQVQLRVMEEREPAGEPRLSITVAQGFLKEKKMDRLVRSLTELGVCRFIPVICNRSVARPSGGRMEARLQRWQRISRQSVKQCRRSCSLEIRPAVEFSAALEHALPDQLKLFFWEEENKKPLEGRLETVPASAFIMVGPEGGFTPGEARLAREAGFTLAGLGPRILRAETATLAAVVLVQYLWGDMGQNMLDNHPSL